MLRLLSQRSNLARQISSSTYRCAQIQQITGVRFSSSSAESDPRSNPSTSTDSKTWPEEGLIGPYPKLPYEYYVHRPQDIKWDDQQGRRNLGEPLHHQFDLIDVWSPDHFDRLPDSKAYKYNAIFFGIIGAFSLYCWYTWEDPKFVRRQYPFNGLNTALGGTDETQDLFRARSDEKY